MAKKLNTRAAAAKLCWQIIDGGQSLDSAISSYFETAEHSPQDRGFIQELTYGVCRWYGELDAISAQLLRTPIRNKDRVIHFVLLVGLYQLRHLETANHAGVAETVSACKQLNKVWAKNVINGCLRNYLRDTPEPKQTDKNASLNRNQLSHPRWIRDLISKSWPSQSNDILEANNNRPPMCLRVNQRQFTRKAYLEILKQASIDAQADEFSRDGIILDKAVAVNALPEFETGACSVQDTAAQLAADFLAPEKGMSILDACAAPGGKTAHLLECVDNNAKVHALDISERRCEQLHNTLTRLELDAQVFAADAAQLEQWPVPDNGYDRILIDAPCSGLGVIRRHPDIKHHRRPNDIATLNKVQQQLLSNLWTTLKPDGLLLYMTCSILPSENEEQAQRFIETHDDAKLEKIEHPNALKLDYGVQTLPGVHNMDGFYYCLLRKIDH